MIDLLIYVVGYEERSGFIAGGNATTAKSRMGLVYTSYQQCSWEENYAAAQARGDRLVEIGANAPSLLEQIEEGIIKLRAGSEVDFPLKVAIDVSSMTRELMFRLMRYMFDGMLKLNLQLVVLYATAEYQEPPRLDGPYVDFQPIVGCEGWTLHPERPLSAVLGLGYEADQAIGTVEYLDPSGIWAFVPNGEDARFRRDLTRANEALWPILEPFHKLEYRIANPVHLYTELRGLVEVLARRSRVILVPGGPKIFSAMALLVGLEMGDEVSVWRASTHGVREIRNVRPSGAVARFDYPTRRQQLVADEAIDGLVV
jgi:hypothetical protein